MPAKTYTCTICGETVTKPKSYAIGDGKRACRTHEETQKAREEILEKKLAEAQEELRKALEKNERRQNELVFREHNPSQVCWCCGRIGVEQKAFFMAMLYEQEKYTLRTGKIPNPFIPDDVRESLAALKGTLCLWYCRYDKENRFNSNFRFFTYYQYQAAMIGGLFLACPHCVKKHKLKTMTQEQQDKEQEEGVDEFWKKLQAHAVAYELLLKPALQEVALSELEKEALNRPPDEKVTENTNQSAASV